MQANEATAWTDYTQAAQAEINTATALQNGDLQTALADISAAGTLFRAGNAALAAATTALNAFNGR